MELPQPLAVQIERVQQLAEHVELGLGPGPVPHPHGTGVAPSAQMRQLALGQVVLAADAVHDLQRARFHEPARRRSWS
jgi:hypothetical protein